MPRYVLKLDAITESDKESVGAKAFNLRTLRALGFEVPDGFVITTEALDRFLRENKLHEPAQRLVSELSTDARSARRIAKRIRKLFDAAGWSDELRSAIESVREQMLARWGKQIRFAVRSSFLSEDDESSSFAGQMATFLNVDPKELLEAVVKCWTSLWSAQALAYRARRGQGVEPKGGVLVQVQLNPEWAGVIFTTDALDNGNRVVVEAVQSLGEELVAGRADPHRIILDGASGELVEYARPAGTKPMPKSTLELLSQQATKLAQSCSEFGDFEWAIADGKFYLLQARPITTAADEGKPPRDDILWSRVLGEEFWSGAVTPLMFSVVGEAIEDAMIRKPIAMIGSKYLSEQRYLRLIFDHVYVNLNALEPVVQLLPEWALTDDVLKMFPEDRRQRIRHHAGFVLPLDLPKALFRFRRSGAPWWFTEAQERFERFVNERIPEVRNFTPPPSDASTDEFRRAYQSLLDLLKEYLEVVVWGVTYAYVFVPLAKKVIELWFDPEDRERLVRLALTNLPGDKNFETAQRMAKLATRLRTLDAFPEIVRKNLGFDEAKQLLEESAAGRKFLTEFYKFLVEYGHRSVDRDIAAPRWADEPQIPFSLICKLAQQVQPQMPSVSEREVFAELERALPIRWLNLFAPVKFPTLKLVIKLARQFLPIRENMRFYADMFLYALRKLTLARADSLISKGVLRPEDRNLVFFLTADELFSEEIESSQAETERLLKRARMRQERFNLNKHRRLPAFLFNGEDYEAMSDELPEGRAFHGLPASPGIGRGKARIILYYEDFFKFNPGEVLLVHYLDPSWFSLIPQASAVVTEVGGQLSHGAIVAREYGVPAVVGVSGILDSVHDGDELLVNGTQGVVYVVSGEDEPQ